MKKNESEHFVYLTPPTNETKNNLLNFDLEKVVSILEKLNLNSTHSPSPPKKTTPIKTNYMEKLINKHNKTIDMLKKS